MVTLMAVKCASHYFTAVAMVMSKYENDPLLTVMHIGHVSLALVFYRPFNTHLVVFSASGRLECRLLNLI